MFEWVSFTGNGGSVEVVLFHSAPAVNHQRNERVFCVQGIPGAVDFGRLERLSLVQQVVQVTVPERIFVGLSFSCSF